MRLRRLSLLVGSENVLPAASQAGTLFLACVLTACQATGDGPDTTFQDDVTPNADGGAGGSGGEASAIEGIDTQTTGGGGADSVVKNPCGSECGEEELCDDGHVGLDDDCDGLVDEDCNCSPGQAHSCFKGDPSFRSTPGCYDGTEKCTELGIWGDCMGGVHATENCFSSDVLGCHGISSVPFATVDLDEGTGNFNNDADEESWEVSCPSGVEPCPEVNGSSFQPLQSGEYSVTYTKVVDGDDVSCTYPLFVGARGLRVELEWNHVGDSGVDLDLHMHEPGTTTPWATSGSEDDCGFSNCTQSAFEYGYSTPDWFSDTGTPPTPLNWYEDPVFEQNTCYFAPRGVGEEWQSMGKGCHSPRLDLDNITCNPGITDPDSYSFCAPENINVDFPPTDVWTRVAVHYYSSHEISDDIYPTVKIYCDGALAAELGNAGFYDPEEPVIFTESQSITLLWLVADVKFVDNQCGQTCVVKPLYLDEASRTPYFSSEDSGFGPAYPTE